MIEGLEHINRETLKRVKDANLRISREERERAKQLVGDALGFPVFSTWTTSERGVVGFKVSPEDRPNYQQWLRTGLGNFVRNMDLFKAIVKVEELGGKIGKYYRRLKILVEYLEKHGRG